MGGHGALSLYLKNPGMYKSVSAYAPITNPLKAPWGEKAFKGYFGDDWQSKGAEHDSTELLMKWKGGGLDILIDVVRWSPEGGDTHTDQSRVPETTSTRTDNYYRRTSSQLQKRLDKRRESMLGINRTTITATLSWLASLMTMWIMRRNISLPSMSSHLRSLVVHENVCRVPEPEMRDESITAHSIVCAQRSAQQHVGTKASIIFILVPYAAWSKLENEHADMTRSGNRDVKL